MITVAALLALPQALTATTFFADTFGSGSTLNQPFATPTPTSASYQTLVGLTNGSWSISSGRLSLTLPNNGSVLGEVLALFTNSPVSLATVGDYIAVSVVFTNATNILSGLAGNSSTINIGLFSSGGVAPNQGNIISSAGTASGGTEDWIGYASRIFWNPSGSATIFTRPAQTPDGFTSQNQDLLFNGASGSQAFNNPAGTSLGSTTGGVTLTQGGTYTLTLTINLTAWGAYGITNTIYAGAGTGGTVIFTQGQTASGSTYVTSGFDGLAIGWRNSSSASQASTMDISSITVSGSVFTPPPPISGPVSVVVATNGSCAFSVSVIVGGEVTYQWHRNGTNLLDGGNISGATSAMLIISPAGMNDVCSGTNGYYVTVTGAGNYSINSTNASLTLCPAANLIWSGGGSDWDVATSSNWLNEGVSVVFNYGDSVTFDDTASGGLTGVNLINNYLSAALVTVSNDVDYTFAGSGSIAGPGALIYEGSGLLTMNCVNSYSGGTIISNSSAWLVLDLNGALGTGPVTFAKAGGKMEVVPTGSVSAGIKGDVIVADDFTVQFDGHGSFAGVFLGNLSGTAGKTLTLTPTATFISTNISNNCRYRIYGTNMVYDANLVLNGPATSQAIYNGTVLAPYGSGTQTYNGIISGNGGLVQRGSGTTILNGANTYNGGTTPTAGTIGFGIDTIGAVSSGPIGTGPLFLSPEVPNATGSGMVMAWGDVRTIANPIQYPSATNNLTLNIGGTNALTFTGPITLNGNDGTGAFTNRIFQITNTALTTFSGAVSGTDFGLIKSGNGVLALNNTETYTGPTTVSNGTLQINGSLDASSAVTVCSNGILAGTGTVNGAVTIQTNGAIAPGTASIGTLNFNSSLDLAGNVKVRVDRSGFACDKAVVTGSLNNNGAGSVIVTNTGAALHMGDTFTPFNKAVTGGANLKVVGAGVGWNSRLANDGTIIVSSTNLPTIQTTLSGSTLTLSWPGYPGWLVQSNSVSLTAATNWVIVPNSGNVTTLDITITAKTNVFYRLLSP